MRRRPTLKDRTRFKPNTRYGTPNEDRDWFKTHQGRQYRIRPKRPDEPGEGFVIIKQIYPGRRLRVGIGPEGAMLADNDVVSDLDEVVEFSSVPDHGISAGGAIDA